MVMSTDGLLLRSRRVVQRLRSLQVPFEGGVNNIVMRHAHITTHCSCTMSRSPTAPAACRATTAPCTRCVIRPPRMRDCMAVATGVCARVVPPRARGGA